MSYLARLTTLCLLIASLCACQNSERYTKKRSPQESLLLRALNDSMQHKKPNALRQIRQQMDQASDSLTWYDYYLMYGRHFLLSDTPDSLLPYAERTLSYIRSLPGETPRTRGLAAMATSSKASYYYLMHYHPDSVFTLYLSAYDLMMASDLEYNLPDISANIADAYVAISDLPNATKWYRRALFLTDSLGLPNRQTLTLYMGLGRVYTILHDFEQAGTYYEQTDEHINELKPNMKSYFLNNYGNYFYFRKDYEQALKTFRRLKAHIESYHAEQNFDMYLCKINMADVFLNLNKTDSARQYVGEAEAFFKKHHVDVGIYYAQTIRIGIALKEKKYAEIQQILTDSELLNVNDIDMKEIRTRYLNEYYAAIGDYRKAYVGLYGSLLLNDSARSNRSQLRSSDIMTRLTEDTIRLHHQLRMNEQEIKYEKTRSLLISVIGLLIIIILLFALWFNHERKRRLQGQLDILNLRMLNVRQRVSPHFVFNVLNSSINKVNPSEADLLGMTAQLIRTNLDMAHRNIITLAEELDFVNQYVAIKQRMGTDNFDFAIDAPPRDKLVHIHIPSMMVQILVENAILHGLACQEGPKKLRIVVECTPEEARVSVIDNGPGFDIRHYNSERSRTGLYIIRTTVSIINQENKKAKMGFDIHNDHGCHATLTIPRNIKYNI
ncbi:MAG: histidine kinase [Prevotella sp.]|nr:histidine kinase [Prevotella sp.]